MESSECSSIVTKECYSRKRGRRPGQRACRLRRRTTSTDIAPVVGELERQLPLCKADRV